jgi:hypothetical protein
MSQRWIHLFLSATGVLAITFFVPAAAAQTPAVAQDGARGVRAGGDFSAAFGPRDSEAYFNYTDYEHNALRLARLRLFGEWRVHPSLSFLAEAQTENGDGVEAVAAYARWRPWPTRGLTLQAGRIPTVVGAFARRAYGADNAVIGLPLAYQYLASLRPDALPNTIDDVVRMRGRGWQPFFPVGSQRAAAGIPLLSSRWDTGVEAGWHGRLLQLSGAITMGAPSVPRLHPTNIGRQWSGRAAVIAAPGLVIGVSGSRGSWINRSVLEMMPADRRESAQCLVGTDVEYGRGRFLLRAEWMHASFDVPFAAGATPVAHLGASTIFTDIRYRIHPRWQIGVRIDHLGFSDVQSVADPARLTSWDAPVERVESVLGYRVTRNIDARAGWQYDWRDGGRVQQRGYPVVQLLAWF